VLEPAAVGVPVLFGPHTEHFRELVDALVQAGGGARVSDAPGLAETLARMLSDERSSRETGERGRRLVEANRGALERSVSLLLRTIDEHTTRSTTGVT
jgi:3-deoxy-D-manno-octulosonic-acid transferase